MAEIKLFYHKDGVVQGEPEPRVPEVEPHPELLVDRPERRGRGGRKRVGRFPQDIHPGRGGDDRDRDVVAVHRDQRHAGGQLQLPAVELSRPIPSRLS
jgi:hypothetical protein